jgi:RNA polymerase sigma factor (sigma-70 family)
MTNTGVTNDLHNIETAESGISSNTPFNESMLQEWMLRIVDQDQAAFALLYENLLGHVYGLALRILKRSQHAEEVVQETFWQVWRQAPRFDPDRGSVKTWVLTMARSRALDSLRRIEPNEYELEPELLSLIEMVDDNMPPDILAASQQGHSLQKALLTLDTLPLQLLSLAFFRGLSHNEIAEYTGIPIGTVKSHIRKALSILRQQLTTDFT